MIAFANSDAPHFEPTRRPALRLHDRRDDALREMLGLADHPELTGRELVLCCHCACYVLLDRCEDGSQTAAVLLDWATVAALAFGNMPQEWRNATAWRLQQAGLIRRAADALWERWGLTAGTVAQETKREDTF